MNLITIAGQIEEQWHTYLHVMPGVNFILMVIVLASVLWVGKQTLQNRHKIMELELESRNKTETGLAKILAKMDRIHPEEGDCETHHKEN